MAKKGTFPDDDPAELLDFIASKLLKKGFAGKLLGRYDGVYIRPHDTDTSAVVRVGKPGLLSKDIGVLVSEGGGGNKDTVRKLEAAGVAGPEVRSSFGQQIHDFPPETPAADIVEFALAALRALGATPADGLWEWEASVPDSG